MGDAAAALELLVALTDPAGRPRAADAIARHVGADALLVLVLDPLVDAFLPAPGYPQTLPGGPGWRALFAACRRGGRARAEVEFPSAAELRPATLVGDGQAAMVFIGAGFDEETAAPIVRAFPLIAHAARCEQSATAAAGQMRAAQDAARQGRMLSAALSAARHDMEQALADAARLNAELRDADQRKDEFLAMLAHELRNPLAPLTTALELIALRRARDQPIDRELDVMARQLGHLRRLVDDLLDVSRITRGRIELRPETLRLDEVLQQAVATARPLIDDREHRLVMTLPPEPVTVRADGVRLVQVFANLLNNAAKYTDVGGRIDVVVDRCGREVVVHVRDTGMGVPAAVLPHVFDLFVQAPRALDRAQGGLGIGLTLVKALVEMQGGRVGVASEGEGRGSEFTVTLPLAAPEAAVGAPRA